MLKKSMIVKKFILRQYQFSSNFSKKEKKNQHWTEATNKKREKWNLFWLVFRLIKYESINHIKAYGSSVRCLWGEISLYLTFHIYYWYGAFMKIRNCWRWYNGWWRWKFNLTCSCCNESMYRNERDIFYKILKTLKS